MPVGETISQDVINQILAREALFSSPIRDDDKLRYLSSRNAWVRVISFVNKGGSAELSENFVLSGVASAHTGSGQNSSFTQYSNIDFNLGSNSNSFYNTTQIFGTRPRPGITSFNIKSKNSGGTIQLAEIGFVVWNKEDLDTIEKLYLRLGFEVMVEWGHTLYIDKDGNLEEYVDQDYSDFFEDSVNESTVKSHIKKNRENTYYNADGFLGYITNFSWSFRQDGGYDCSIKVISAGAVIESLLGKVGSSDKSELPISDSYTSDFHSLYYATRALAIDQRYKNQYIPSANPYAPGSGQQAVTQEKRSNKLLFFDDKIIIKGTSEQVRAGTNITDIATSEPGANLLAELAAEFEYFQGSAGKYRPLCVVAVVNSVEVLEEEAFENPNPDFKLDPVFMPLRYCLALVNSMIKRQNGDRSVLFDLTSREKFLTSTNLIVTKPLKTVLLQRPNPDEDRYALYFEDAYDLAATIVWEFATNTYAPTSNAPSLEDLGPDEILNIFVNTEVFVRNIDSLRESDPENSTTDLLTLLSRVLDEINQSVSYGIDLTVVYDEEIGKYKIIDVGKLPGRNTTPKEIKISGTSTTVSSLSITSKITNKLGNQISIAAQTVPSSYPASVIKYREWNQDLTSRLRRISSTRLTADSRDTVTVDQVVSYFRKLNIEYRRLNERDIYDSDEWDSFYARSQIITREGIDYDPAIPKGLIPIELSFTMDGIAGLKILQSFKIPDELLPENYSNEYVGFIINGLEHTIENNKWFTQVRAQMYLFRPPGRPVRPMKPTSTTTEAVDLTGVANLVPERPGAE